MNSIDPCGWFQWYFRYWLGIKSLDDKRKIARWGRIVSRFKGRLVQMCKDGDGSLDDYPICLKLDRLYWIGPVYYEK